MNYAKKLRFAVLFGVGMAFSACSTERSFKGGANTARGTADQNSKKEGTPKVDQETPEVVETTLEVVKKTPEVVEKTPEVVEKTPEVVEKTPKVVEKIPEVETDNVFKDCAKSLSAQFQGDLYELPPQTNRLPDFEKLTPIKKICLKQIDITERSFTEGFPGVDALKEWFAIKFDFNLKIEKEGEYRFVLNSDDGSRLYIDGKEIIDNDGQHGPEEKSSSPILLTAGTHKISLPYFQGPAQQIALELFWIPPGGNKEYIPVMLI